MAKKYKMTRKQLEDKVRQLELEPYEPTPERVEEIKQRAFEMYEREINAKKELEEKKAEKKGRRRRVVVVAALTVAFLLISFVYNAVTPMTVANANSFMKRAVIWINDKLHLGIEFEVPVDDGSDAKQQTQTEFYSISDFCSKMDMPIIGIHESESIGLDLILVDYQEGELSSISLQYTCEAGTINIFLRPMLEKRNVLFDNEALTVINTNIGELYLWETEAGIKGLMYYNAYSIDIFSQIELEDVIKYCSEFIVY